MFITDVFYVVFAEIKLVNILNNSVIEDKTVIILFAEIKLVNILNNSVIEDKTVIILINSNLIDKIRVL